MSSDKSGVDQRQRSTSQGTRAIQPFNAWRDGDVFFTVSTEEVENAELSEIALGAVASELAWDAVLSCF